MSSLKGYLGTGEASLPGHTLAHTSSKLAVTLDGNGPGTVYRIIPNNVQYCLCGAVTISGAEGRVGFKEQVGAGQYWDSSKR